MNIFEFACFVGLPSIVAFGLLFGLPQAIRLSLAIGAGSAFVSLFAVILFSYLYRLSRRRRLEKAHVPIWAVLAIVLSASVALYCRIQHLKRENAPNAQHTADGSQPFSSVGVLHAGIGEAKSPWNKTGPACDWELYASPQTWQAGAPYVVEVHL